MFVISLVSSSAESSQSRKNSHSESLLEQLLALDDTRLCARLVVMVTDETQYHQVLALRGGRAQAFLNLLQLVCSQAILFGLCIDIITQQQRLNFETDLSYRRRLVKTLILLFLGALDSILRACFSRGSPEEPKPVGRGGFADVYRGVFQGRPVAIKILRVYERTDVDKLLKVLSLFLASRQCN